MTKKFTNDKEKDIPDKSPKQKRLEELSEQIEGLVGFGAAQEYGSRLSEKEIELISTYCSEMGGNKERIAEILKNAGRPFDISDYHFDRRCLLCKSLANYCCC